MLLSLQHVVQGITRDTSLWDDLMQEALLHLWLTEARRPGQTKSWYLQSCRFHLQHYLSSGRSVDSVKRRKHRLVVEENNEDFEELNRQVDPGDSVFACVSARELTQMLSNRLDPQARAVLSCLADGLGLREISRELKISHTMVVRHRREIARSLTQLEKKQWVARNGHSAAGNRNNQRVPKPINGKGKRSA